MKKTRTKKQKEKYYPSHYLAIVLSLVLICEGMVIESARTNDWQSGIALLDVSSGYAQTKSDVLATFQPEIDMAANINEFYRLTTDQMAIVLDLSSNFSDASIVYTGVAEFYNQASTEMAQILDFSSASAANLYLN